MNLIPQGSFVQFAAGRAGWRVRSWIRPAPQLVHPSAVIADPNTAGRPIEGDPSGYGIDGHATWRWAVVGFAEIGDIDLCNRDRLVTTLVPHA